MHNAFEYVYREWHRKPVGFAAYDSALGARTVEQFRLVVAELQMAPVRSAVHLPREVYMAVKDQEVPVSPELFAPAEGAKNALLDDLIWWGNVLKRAREDVLGAFDTQYCACSWYERSKLGRVICSAVRSFLLYPKMLY